MYNNLANRRIRQWGIIILIGVAIGLSGSLLLLIALVSKYGLTFLLEMSTAEIPWHDVFSFSISLGTVMTWPAWILFGVAQELIDREDAKE